MRHSELDIDRDYFEALSRPDELNLLRTFARSRQTRSERLAEGLALRKAVPRREHAVWQPAAERADVVEVLQAQNATLIKELVPIRMGRMASSPFAFLRGAAAIMAADLATTPATGLNVAACGDMHVANFGVYASAERDLVFAINDFDEVFPGPWEWDLKRLAASAAVAAAFLGGDALYAEEAARSASRSYRERMLRYAQMGFLEVWYDRIDERTILDAAPPGLRRPARRLMDRVRARGHMRALDRLTEEVNGQHQFIENLPLVERTVTFPDGTPIREALDSMLHAYVHSLAEERVRLLSRYRIVDVARKVVGVGSVGTSCWVVLLQGLNPDDPLFLQVKEARESVLAPYSKLKLPYANQGRRVVVGQRLIQGSPDIFLGWGPAEGQKTHRHFYVRQISEMKGGVRFTDGDTDALNKLVDYCGICGWALALAHAKSGDPAIIAGYCGKSEAFDDAMGKFAMEYLDQTERDHESLTRAIRDGRIEAEREDITRH